MTTDTISRADFAAETAKLPTWQIERAVKRAQAQLAILEWDELEEPGDDFDGPFPPSKAYETYKAQFTERRRRMLNQCIALLDQELAQRNI